GRVVDQVPRREVVGAVDDQVIRGEDLHHVGGVQPLGVQDDVHVRVDLDDRVTRGFRLGLAHVGDAVDDLPLQVRLIDRVEVHDAERPDAGRGEVQQRRGAEAARADYQHLGVLQAL